MTLLIHNCWILSTCIDSAIDWRRRETERQGRVARENSAEESMKASMFIRMDGERARERSREDTQGNCSSRDLHRQRLHSSLFSRTSSSDLPRPLISESFPIYFSSSSSVFTFSVVFPERCGIRYAPDPLLMNLWWIYIVTLLTFRWQTIRSEVPRCRSPFRKISVISGVFLGAKRTDGDNSPSMEIQRSKCTPDPADMVLKSKRLGEWGLTKMKTHTTSGGVYTRNPPLASTKVMTPEWSQLARAKSKSLKGLYCWQGCSYAYYLIRGGGIRESVGAKRQTVLKPYQWLPPSHPRWTQLGIRNSKTRGNRHTERARARAREREKRVFLTIGAPLRRGD